LSRHAAKRKRKHWHLDYLLPYVQIFGALVIEDRRRLECDWAVWIGRTGGLSIKGFGASDCRCPGRLFRLGFRDGNHFIASAQSKLMIEYFPIKDFHAD
jgi:sugar fermentation stimulation protein A